MSTNPKVAAAKLFGRNLRMARRLLEWSQEELAHRAGLYRTQISPIEQGEGNCTLETAERLAKALGLQVHELLDPALDLGQLQVRLTSQNSEPPTAWP